MHSSSVSATSSAGSSRTSSYAHLGDKKSTRQRYKKTSDLIYLNAHRTANSADDDCY